LHISELTKGVCERILTIKGTPEQVGSAFEMVCPKLVEAEAEKNEITLTLLVPNIMAGRIIGKGGEKIKSIKQNSGCNINVANDPIENSTERKVTLTGSTDSVLAALPPIVTVLAENTNRIRDAQMVYYTPGAPQVPMMGQPPTSFLSPLLLSGQIPQLNAAVMAAQAQQAQAHHALQQQRKGQAAVAPVQLPVVPQGQEQILTIQINVPANSIGAIIGHRGANIRDIRRQSGADINVAEAAFGDERSIMIKGNLHQNELALYLIQTTLAAAPAARRPKAADAAK